jgi:hypothetical protein
MICVDIMRAARLVNDPGAWAGLGLGLRVSRSRLYE